MYVIHKILEVTVILSKFGDLDFWREARSSLTPRPEGPHIPSRTDVHLKVGGVS